MTDAVLDTAPPGRDRLTPWLFALAVFVSAALVFGVQPMATKLILPMLGGSPAVWNTAMVFFQAALLAGYAYAHLLQKIRALRSQMMAHLALLALAGLFLPLRISGALGDPDPSAPAPWLLGTLALSVGAPFAVLSATAPLMQAWFARARAGHADGANPYVLYAASNLGSFLALLAYPVVVEPLASLGGQRLGWSGGYAAFMLLVVGLALAVGRRGAAGADGPAPLAFSPAVPWREKGVWILLAAAPSSLMLGVTAHLTTDVASAPFLWVMPLALYLLTFVIAFQTRPWAPSWLTLMIQAALGGVCASAVAFRTGEWGVMFLIHLGAFFITALMCHQALAARRPPPDRLTEFYLLMSLGGVFGGAFTALLAPMIFPVVWEYPLVLVLVGLARPWGRGPVRLHEALLVVLALFLTLTPPVGLAAIRDTPALWGAVQGIDLMAASQLILGLTAICAFLVRDRAVLFTLVVGMIALSAQYVARGYDWALTERSFFGVMRVADIEDQAMGGRVHVLMHGTTLHGSQARNPEFACTPTLYYAPLTPLGQAAGVMEARLAQARIGVVGQGAGAMAAYKRAGDDFTFFEIDPMVDRMARDPRWFTYISDCAQGPVRTVLGDALLTLKREPAGSYDLLVIDAFSSDSVPTHLLTVEALREYLRLLKPDGVVVLHLSNRNLEITRPAVAAARAAGGHDLHQIFYERQGQPDMLEASTEALLVSPTEEGLLPYLADPEQRWRRIVDPGVRPWTEDYVNLFGALARQMAQ